MKILFIRKSSLGDIIHAIPAFYELRDAFPDAEIHWAVAPAGAQILEHIGGIDRIRSISQGFLRGLRHDRFDLAIDLQGLLKTAVMARLAGQRRYGFARGHTREPFCQLFYTDTVFPTGVHIIDKNISLIASVTGRPRSTGPYRFGELLSEEDISTVDEQLSSAGISPGYVLLNPGAGWKNKQWSPLKFGELAKRLSGHRVALVSYSPAERPLAERVVRASEGAARLAPSTSFMGFGALAARSALVVSGDTGPMHFACAMGVRILGLFAPTSPFRNGPWNPGDRFIIASTRCDFCWKRSCPWENCIDKIEVDQVLRLIEEMLES